MPTLVTIHGTGLVKERGFILSPRIRRRWADVRRGARAVARTRSARIPTTSRGARARSAIREAGLEATFVQGDATDPAFLTGLSPTGTFDLVTLAFIHPEPEERDSAYAHLPALVAPGGHLLVIAHDPEAMDEARDHYLGDEIEYAESPMDAIEGADALVIVTEWNEFRRPDFEALRSGLKQPVIFDGRNIFPRKTLEELGFTYHALGR